VLAAATTPVLGLTAVGGLLVAIVVGGGAGAMIGMYKNRPLLGFILGFILGCLGWLIIALIPKKRF
jgi:hypothetical protein